MLSHHCCKYFIFSPKSENIRAVIAKNTSLLILNYDEKCAIAYLGCTQKLKCKYKKPNEQSVKQLQIQ
ncbi:16755_t:CDS:2 [Cetraspora pellucida]|uniref:16755_t:CDS:1 n=1 Tax=Cetraspora pellucida TaxID=1433469 RepID=A0A9N8ZXV0_9GLOM|nr:16755_t:CDS:2 [Cetraspora pellucida]